MRRLLGLCVLVCALLPANSWATPPIIHLESLQPTGSTGTPSSIKDRFDDDDREDPRFWSHRVGDHLFSFFTYTADLDLEVGILRQTMGLPVATRGLAAPESIYNIYGDWPELKGFYAVDIVDDSEPELVVVYSYSVEGSCDDDEHECEAAGPVRTAIVVLDTSLSVLGVGIGGREDGWGDNTACAAKTRFEDTDGDGRREMHIERECTGDDASYFQKPSSTPLAHATPAPAPKGPATTAINDDRPFVVIAGTYKKAASAYGMAMARAAELREDDVPGAAVYDSQQFEELAWGYYTVVAGRTATKEEAEALALEVSGDTYVKQGFFQKAPLPAPEAGCESLENGVLQQARGYRLRLSVCEGKRVQAEIFNASASRKAHQSVFSWEGALSKPAYAALLGDEAGKPSAIVVTAVADTGTTVFVVASDKREVVLWYGATLPSASSVLVEGATLTCSGQGATRTVSLPTKRKATKPVVARSADDTLTIAPWGTFDIAPRGAD